NYTDFKKTDLRLMAGFGLSAIGYFNEMIEFSVPLTKSPFQDIGRVTLVIFVN
ncbi:MAG: hypothetical protein IT236_03145, partial [Bacteroidia bacterium]|nr:hypothetical protein [Bacteroidia bacterium]